MFALTVPYITTHPFDEGWVPNKELKPNKKVIWYRQLESFRDYKKFQGEDCDELAMSEENARKRIAQGKELGSIFQQLGGDTILSLGSGKGFHERSIAHALQDVSVIGSDVYYRETCQENNNLTLTPLDISKCEDYKRALDKWRPDSILIYTVISVITDEELQNIVNISREKGVKYIVLYTAEEMRALNLIKYCLTQLKIKILKKNVVNRGYLRSVQAIRKIFYNGGYAPLLDKIITKENEFVSLIKGSQRFIIFEDKKAEHKNSLSDENFSNVDFGVFEHTN